MMGVLFMKTSSRFQVSGSALGADKKINLASWIYVIVCAPTAARSSTQRRSVDVRSHALHLAYGYSVARLARPLRALELGLYALASLVPVWTVATVVGRTGAQRSRPVALSRRQPCQSASRRQQSRRWPTKSSHWTHQGRAEHQNQCVGGRARTGGEFELGPDSTPMCASHRPPRVRHCVARPRWPTRVTTATVFARCCGAGAATLAFHRAATGSIRWAGIAVITRNGTRWKTCFND